MSAPRTATPRNVLILGASSGIARAVIERLAREGATLALAARDMRDIQKTCADVGIRYGATAQAFPLDVRDFALHPGLFQEVRDYFKGELDGVILCFGALAEQKKAAENFADAQAMIDCNYTGAVSLLNLAANYFETRGRGFICALSSVAGDRGRQSNYIYGSSKAALTVYLQGLRHRLAPAGVRVLTVKPGFVDTGMTWGVLQGGPLVARPEVVARDICRALARGAGEIYSPWFWRWIMFVIRNLPERIFVKTKL